ncbi:MAG: SDR family NAD(P)-dependent oxidoreductase [Bacillota bacterium]
MGLLQGKNCIITGSGRGIGKATAIRFAQEGANVVISDIDPIPANETVEEIKAAGGNAIACPGDVTSPDFGEQIVKACVEAFGPVIDVIVNNAGYTWDNVLHKMTDQQWDAMMAVHCTGPFRIIRSATPYMRDVGKKEAAEKGYPTQRHIINISSTSGTDGNAGQLNYSCAKAGVVGMTKTIAKEWGPYGVNCNSIAFGWVETRLTMAKENTQPLKRDGKEIPIGIPGANIEAMKTMIPLRRAGTPEDAAGVMLFLASDLSNYVSGQVIKMNGGMS